MLSQKQSAEFYEALANRDSAYAGLFIVGVKTTGIFCRPGCTARTPKPENCDFFPSAQDALLAGFRPCKRCHPTGLPGEPSAIIKTLSAALEAEPEKRWNDEDVAALGFDPSTVRRHFKERFGITFIAFARARRMGLALTTIKNGEKVINAQLDAGYESGSGFRDAFSRIMGAAPNAKNHTVLKAEWLDTPLGAMLAIADDTHLHLLEFTDRRGLEREIERMRKRLRAAIIPGHTTITDSIEKELAAYFKGTLKEFKTPVKFLGSPFQQTIWTILRDIPYATTRTYAEQAALANNPKAVRAAGTANGCNQLAIIIPCHRVVGSDGKLTGYAGGLARKQWLLDHERRHANA